MFGGGDMFSHFFGGGGGGLYLECTPIAVLYSSLRAGPFGGGRQRRAKGETIGIPLE